jgi:hypothetical protein
MRMRFRGQKRERVEVHLESGISNGESKISLNRSSLRRRVSPYIVVDRVLFFRVLKNA